MAIRDIVAIGGSAGSLEAIREIVRHLPSDLPASVFVVMHLLPRGRTCLDEVLQSVTAIPVSQAREGEPIEKTRIYVGPPDRHLLIAQDHVHLTRGPREGLHRPSINVTFRSAAAAFRERVVGVLLSGMLDDGASGIWEIGRRGGLTIVQDPGEARFPSMPLNALQDATVHYSVPVKAIPSLVSELVLGQRTPVGSANGDMEDSEKLQFSGFTCPECRGPLYEVRPHLPEFRCRAGHVLSLETLLEEHTSTQERKLYEALVALSEGADLADYTATRTRTDNRDALKREAAQLRRQADLIRAIIEEREMPPAD